MYNWIVFIDFDGTITAEETLSGALGLLNPPGLRECVDRMLAKELTLSEGLRGLFSKVPSNRYPEVDAYIRSVPVRDGFGAFLERLSACDIPVVVISGGLTQMIDATLEPYRHLLLDVHSVHLDLTGDTMRLDSPHDDGVELMKKTAVMGRYTYKKAIAIGDSYTDFNMSQAADLVFARDELARFLEESSVPFYSWDTFHDIAETLKKHVL